MPRSTAPVSEWDLVNRFQVFLLALTGLVLSVASGWTTWIGMTNFTHESVLSLMITFGIQGVMMALSWVLGSRLASTLAVGYAAGAIRNPESSALVLRIVEGLLISALLMIAFIVIAQYFDLLEEFGIESAAPPISASALAGISLVLLTVLILIPYGPGFIHGTVAAFATVGRNLIVLCMLAACLFASVFFSFDSLFSRILPDEERRRIADFRSTSVVSDIHSELYAVATEEFAATRNGFFKSREWSAYNAQVDDLIAGLSAMPKAIDAQIARERRRHKASEALRSSKVSEISIERNRLLQQRLRLNRELEDAQAKLAPLQQVISGHTESLANLQRQIALKKVEMDDELKGLGVTKSPGVGKVYLGLKDEFQAMQSTLRRITSIRDVVKAQHDGLIGRISKLRRTIARSGSNAQRLANDEKSLKAQKTEAGSMAQLQARRSEALEHVERLQAVRQRFQVAPNETTIAALERQCLASLDVVKLGRGQAATRNEPACGLTSLRAKAAPLFNLQTGLERLQAHCRNQSQANRAGKAFEDTVAKARQCIVQSGLLPAQSAALTAKLDGLERERDDKAHRFVVSMNAFADGNKLAYLAAGIALAIDLLVLVSGLLGALALQPRAADVVLPSEKRAAGGGDDATQIAKIVRGLRLAFGSDANEKAKCVLGYIEPVTMADEIGMKIDMSSVRGADKVVVRDFLNAGAAFAQAYGLSTGPSEVGIRNNLYLAALELGGLSTGRTSVRNAMAVAATGIVEAFSAPNPSTSSSPQSTPDVKARSSAVTQGREAPPSGTEPATVSSEEIDRSGVESQSSTAVSGRETGPAQAPKQPADERSEARLVSVSDGGFKFDY